MKLLKPILFFTLASLLIFGGLVFLKNDQFRFKRSERDFVYLANILYNETKDISSSQEKLVKMTDWLHENVKHVSPYPPGFNGKGVANVIRGGAGNCGFQSCNISVFADMLGHPDHRIYHYQKVRGSQWDHAFAEININGNWQVYDPDLMIYQRSSNDKEVLGVSNMKSNPELVKHKLFKDIITQTIPDPFVVTKSWQPTPSPFGKDGYLEFAKQGGEEGFKRQLILKKHGLKYGIISILFAGLLTLIFTFLLKARTKK